MEYTGLVAKELEDEILGFWEDGHWSKREIAKTLRIDLDTVGEVIEEARVMRLNGAEI